MTLTAKYGFLPPTLSYPLFQQLPRGFATEKGDLIKQIPTLAFAMTLGLSTSESVKAGARI